MKCENPTNKVSLQLKHSKTLPPYLWVYTVPLILLNDIIALRKRVCKVRTIIWSYHNFITLVFFNFDIVITKMSMIYYWTVAINNHSLKNCHLNDPLVKWSNLKFQKSLAWHTFIYNSVWLFPSAQVGKDRLFSRRQKGRKLSRKWLNLADRGATKS